MKLFSSPASPYVRKVKVCAHEIGLGDRLAIAEPKLSPVSPSAELNAQNPLGKIPALVLEDGSALFDSRVICEYLDTLHGGRKLFPRGAKRWHALRRQALADGMLDAAVNARYEQALRPEAYQWPDWIAGQKSKFQRAIDALETEVPSFGRTIDIGTISIGCALGYLDFRYATEGWRDRHPRLSTWFARFSARPSMKATEPSG